MNEYLKNNPNMIVPHLLEFLREYREKECADVPVIVEAIERLRHLENQVLQMAKAGDEMAKDLSNPIDPDILKYYSVEKWDEIVMKNLLTSPKKIVNL